ncbi:hypothetical protein FIBSPDRAFT_872866 [Athelia psychrophila]|uniref:Uncharacterized protein n=1 Tax=Athelia psychrophila TaxID=1759441 RepID=A0A165Z446_9AGAM|nr:hypothetical protein FIBSPDRAFT_872866 [Fibularhizoctonia sp. CBS 109695]
MRCAHFPNTNLPLLVSKVVGTKLGLLSCRIVCSGSSWTHELQKAESVQRHKAAVWSYAYERAM